jgi:uroporphyrinogen decarboxylase
MISHRERLEACLSNQVLDRPPVALWRHFPVDDQTPQGLANATLVFQRTFDFDFVKVTPSSSYCLKDWGSRDEWRGDSEGTRDYTQRIIQHPEDWAGLPLLDPHKGHLAEELECLRLLKKELGVGTPIIQTIFNPLSQAKNLVGGEQLLVHARLSPDALHAGLQIITESTSRFIEAVAQTGVDGIFFAVQHAQYALMSEAEYQHFGQKYDLQLLEPAKDAWLRLLHLHGEDVMFDLVKDYPVNILNWHDRETTPSLQQALKTFKGAVCGGTSRHRLVFGSPDELRSEALEAIQATSGQRFILGTGCVTPIIAPYGNILAVRQSVE